jgi:hypothetical protein
MLRVPQHHPGHEQRGRGCCAISGRPGTSSGTQRTRPTSPLFALSLLFRVLSPSIPVHPRNAPVSPIIPVLTQKQGGGGVSRHMRSPVTLLFSSAMLTTTLSAIVGAPTISTPHPNSTCPRLHRNHDYPLANQRLFVRRLLHAPSPIDVHSGCRRERTPDSLHILMTNAPCAPAAGGFAVFLGRYNREQTLTEHRDSLPYRLPRSGRTLPRASWFGAIRALQNSAPASPGHRVVPRTVAGVALGS